MKNSHYIKEVKVLTENNKNTNQTSRIEDKKRNPKIKEIIYWIINSYCPINFRIISSSNVSLL